MKQILYTGLALVFLLTSCEKENLKYGQHLQVPSTYTFANVNYSGQTVRLEMLVEMIEYAKTARTSGVVLDAAILKNMFSNTGSPFLNSDLNTSGKQLKNKCFIPDQPLMEAYMDSLAIASSSGVAGSNGVAGIVTSSIDATKKYVLSANGWDYTEMIEKGLMGSVFYYQAMSTYLENLSIDDNTTVIPGEGTVMEHHFDEAFGYFGVPVDFPVNTTDVLFWGEYCNDLNEVLGTNQQLMKAFLTARSAISAKKYSIRDSKVEFIRANWEKIIAASAIHEVNQALASFSDDAVRNHTLSEFVGFVMALKYSPHTSITTSQINTIIGYIGTNLYSVSSANLNLAKDMLSSIYGLDDVKNEL